MKKRINKTYVFLFLIALLGCEKKEETGFFIRLSDHLISTDFSGTIQKIRVESNCEWGFTETPSWCEAVTKNSLSDVFIELTIQHNSTFNERGTKLTVYGKGVHDELVIKQTGIYNRSGLEWQAFPVNNIADAISEKINDNSIEYRIIANELFINPALKNRIYHGNLIQKSIGNIANPPTGLQYTYNPITISCFVDGILCISENKYPSLTNTYSLATEALSSIPNQNQNFYYQDKPIQYNSYRHLNLLGIGNLGIELEKVITAQSYKEKELGNRTGLIYSYRQDIFKSTMDYSDDLVQETLSSGDAEKVAYVNSISYGKTALLIVETDFDYETSRNVVNKIIKSEELDHADKEVIETIVGYYLFFNSDSEIQSKKGDIDVIKIFRENINKEAIIPLSFSLLNYADNSLEKFEFKFFSE